MRSMNTLLATSMASAALFICSSAFSADKIEVNITPEMASVDVMHDGKKITIRRNQDQNNIVNPDFSRTSRKCPPFCIQPAVVAPGVETIAELEVLAYLDKMSAGDDSILVVDSRTPDWVKRGTIPGSINIPWTNLNTAMGADPISISEIMVGTFGVKELEGLWDYSDARTLVMFCNGAWCGQSPNNIMTLLKFGYPADRIKWYRGGMQDWEILGLSTVPGK